MKDIVISATEETPEVVFRAQAGTLMLRGRSLPENAYDFFRPLLIWIESYLHNGDSPPIEMTVKLEYFNSSSNRFLLKMLSLIANKHHRKDRVLIKWYYEIEDELLQEKGECLAELVDLPFEMCPVGVL